METQEVMDNPDVTATEQMLTETGMQGSAQDPDGFSPQEESPVLEKPESTEEGHSELVGDSQKASQSSNDSVLLEKRLRDTQRWGHQLQKEKEGLAKELAETKSRWQKYENAGLDFEEIDRFIEGNSGTPKRREKMDSSAETQNSDVVTKAELNTIVTRYNYDMAKRDFADVNPEFRDADVQELLDIEAQKIAAVEMREHGAIISQVDEIVRNASKKVTARINKFKNLGAKSVTEKREQIKSAAIPDGESVKKQAAAEEVEYRSKQDFVNQQIKHRQGIKQKQKRGA